MIRWPLLDSSSKKIGAGERRFQEDQGALTFKAKKTIFKMVIWAESKCSLLIFQPSLKEQSQGKNKMLYANTSRNFYHSQ